MEEAIREKLTAAGVDVESLLERFMGSEALAMKFLARFPQDTNFSRLQQALEGGDAAQAFEAAHTLKGVAGNLSLQALFAQTSAVVEDLRAGALDAARQKMPELAARYARAVQALNALA